MKIESLELRGYKRLMVNNIHYLKLTPKSKIQLILGTNGSGKSSLLKELSPLPGTPAEYEKDGHKIVELTHRNSRYITKNQYLSSGNRYSIYKDGEEIYEGPVLSVYRDHIQKEFGLTQQRYDIITGQVNSQLFTEMSVADRRNWLTEINTSDFTYAIRYYNKLQENLRDSQGAVKVSQTRLVQESAKVLTEDKEREYRDRIKNLKETLEYLLSIKSSMDRTPSELSSIYQSLENQLMQKSQQLLGLIRTQRLPNHIQSMEDLDREIYRVTQEIGEIKGSMATLFTQIEKQRELVASIEKSSLSSLGDLDQKEKELLESMDTLLRMIKYPQYQFEDNQIASNALNANREILEEIALNIPLNQDGRFNRTHHQLQVESLERLRNTLRQQEATKDQYLYQKKEMEYAKEKHHLTCPSCSHQWYQGYSEEGYEKLLTAVEEISRVIESTKKTITATESYLEEAKTFYGYLRAYSDIITSWKALKPFWDILIENTLISQDPRSIVRLMTELAEDFTYHLKLDQIKDELKEIYKLQKTLSENSQSDFTKLKEDIQILELRYEKYQISHDQKKKELDSYFSLKKTVESITQLSGELEGLLDQRAENARDQFSAIRQSTINSAIQQVKLELTELEQVISRLDIQKALVAQLESQIEESKEKVELFKIAVKSLSPKEGLIAKGLIGFINHVLEEINEFIKKIWSYPLELQPIEVDEDSGVDLDYRFPVLVNENALIPDVSRTSSAMKEVINLAFRVVSMEYIGLGDFPLHLDEFGARMDHAHRHAAFNVVTNLLTSEDFSQIYMVSHAEQSYGSLRNTDITVLCESNVVLPKETPFNQAVIIH